MKQSLHDRLITAFSFFAGAGIAASAIIGYGFVVPLAGSGYTVKQICVFMGLSAIAAGSYTGALVSNYKRNDKLLLLAVLIPGLLMLTLPLYTQLVESLSGPLNSILSIVLYGFFVLFLPMACISQVIPLTIAGLKGGAAGIYARKTGIVFSVVMMGAAFGSIAYTTWIIPMMGLIGASMVTGFLLAIIPAVQIFRQGWRKPGILAILMAIILPGVFIGSDRAHADSVFNTLNFSEHWTFNEASAKLNGAWFCDLNSNRQDSKSVVQSLLENCFPETEILLIGSSDGQSIRTCQQNNLNLTLLDSHQDLLWYHANQLNADKHLFVETQSPRTFLNSTAKQYDIVIIDQMRGDEIPSGIFTAESVMKIRSLLKPGGLGIIRLPHTNGEAIQWYGTRSLFKTIRSMGLFTEISKPYKNEPALLFFSGSRDAFDDRLEELEGIRYFPLDSIKVTEVRILTDNRPMLGLYYRTVMDSLRSKRSKISSEVQALK
jgi:predicted membrane-bound spermidine synthase